MDVTKDDLFSPFLRLCFVSSLKETLMKAFRLYKRDEDVSVGTLIFVAEKKGYRKLFRMAVYLRFRRKSAVP